jgi:hypothetical protein
MAQLINVALFQAVKALKANPSGILLGKVKALLELQVEEAALRDLAMIIPTINIPVQDHALVMDIYQIIFARASITDSLILAQVITLFLDYLQASRSLDVSLPALRLLKDIVSRSTPDQMAQFLPGLITKISIVAVRDLKANHKLPISCLELSLEVLLSCLADKHCADLILKLSKYETTEIPSQIRNLAWHSKTVVNLKPIIMRFLGLIQHSNPKVRTHVGVFCLDLLQKCHHTLDVFHASFCKTLMTLCFDEFSPLASETRQKLSECNEKTCTILEMHSRDSLSLLLAKLNFLVKDKTNSEILATLKLVNGLLLFLGHKAKICIEMNMNNLKAALLHIVTPSTNNLHAYSRSVDTLNNVSFPRLTYQNHNDSQIVSNVQEFFRILCEYCLDSYLINELVDTCLFGNEYSLEASILLKELSCFTTSINSIEPVLDFFNTSLKEFKPTNITDHNLLQLLVKEKSSFNLQSANMTILQQSAMLQLIATSARRMEGQNLEYFLIEGLYNILSLFAEPNQFLHDSANATLFVLSERMCAIRDEVILNPMLKTDADPSLSNLIMMHADYLLDSCSRKLSFVKSNPICCRVLSATIKITGSQIVELMTDVVDQILDTLDIMGSNGNINGVVSSISPFADNGYITKDLLQVLFELVKVIPPQHSDTYRPLDQNVPWDKNPDSEFSRCSRQVCEYYLLNEPTHQKTPFEGNAQDFFTARLEKDDPVLDNGDDAASQVDSKEPVLSTYEKIGLKILERCVYLFNSDSSNVRALCLQIFQHGLLCLNAKERNPLIHKAWPFLISRCHDSKHYVQIEAIKLLGIISKLGKEFVRRKINEDITMAFINVFRKIQKGANKSQTQVGKMLISSKLDTNQQESNLLNNMFATCAIIIENVPQSSRERNQLMEIMFTFLSKHYSTSVQDQASKIIESLAAHNREWMFLLVWAIAGSPNLELKGLSRLSCNRALSDYGNRDINIQKIVHLLSHQEKCLLNL